MFKYVSPWFCSKENPLVSLTECTFSSLAIFMPISLIFSSVHLYKAFTHILPSCSHKPGFIFHLFALLDYGQGNKLGIN